MERNSGEIVVITGASAGVGRATARAFARDGARLGLIARGRAGLEAACREVEALGGTAIPFMVDVADADAVEKAASAVEDRFGAPTIWVNNAMVSVFSPVSEMTPQDYRRVTEVTYLGVVHGTMSALRRMRPRNRGTIVQVGSALAYRGIPLQSAYCGAKHAIQGFNDSLRAELHHDRSRVRISMVQMPALNTPQFAWTKSRMPHRAQPVPPIFQPEVAAAAIVHAARHYRREWYVGWPTVKAIIGNRIAPGALDRYLGDTGYASQQYDGGPAHRRSNLFEPMDDEHDFGAHGDFDHRATSFSWQYFTDRHRRALAVAAACVGGLLALVWRAHPGREAPNVGTSL